jgi:alpha-L-fucosidase
MWFDGGWMEGWTPKDGKDIYNYLHKLDPSLIINNRLTGAGDYETPEQQIPPNGIPGHYWETCMTINDDWGYNAADSNFKSSETLIRNLIDIASKGGNYLLNVGPTAMGVIPKPEVDRLDTMGTWLKANGEAIYGTTASPFTTQLPWGRCTQKPGELFFEVFDWPKDGKLVIHGVHSKPERAFILSDKERTTLKVSRRGDALVVNVPDREPDKICTVVALEFAGKPVVYNPPLVGPMMKSFLSSTVFTISPAPGTEIRYTLDGQTPTVGSPLYSHPVTITDPMTVTACYFRDGQAVSGTSSATFTKLEAKPAVSLNGPSSGVEYKYFTGEWTSVPDFTNLKPVRESVMPDFALPKKRALQYYAIEYMGYVYVPVTGVYTFYTSSDDGSNLYIGNDLVVNNDGLHGMTEEHGIVALEKGFHRIRVGYFQSQGSDGLEVKYEGPGVGNKPIPIPDTVIYFKR